MHPQAKNDLLILRLLTEGRLKSDPETGSVHSSVSNHPSEPLGSRTKKGYVRVSLNVNGRQVAIMIHRVVWIAANGLPPPTTPQINHIDTVKSHNWLSNLELQDNAGNMRHAAANGCLRVPRGERCHRSKLTRADVLLLRSLAAGGMRTKDLAERFGIAPTNARRIVLRKCWAWLTDDPLVTA